MISNGITSFLKRSTLPTRMKFPQGGQDKNLFLAVLIKCIRTYKRGEGVVLGVTSSVLCGGVMGVFWNDPLDRVKNKVGHIKAHLRLSKVIARPYDDAHEKCYVKSCIRSIVYFKNYKQMEFTQINKFC